MKSSDISHRTFIGSRLLTGLLGLVLVTSTCQNGTDVSDNVLFGLTAALGNTTCSSKINVSKVELDLVEDGDLAYNSTATASSVGYYEQQVCVYPTESFTGTVSFPIRVKNGTDRITFPDLTVPGSLTFTGYGSSNQKCFIIRRVDNSIDDPKDSVVIEIGRPTTADAEDVYSNEDPCDISVNIEDDEGARIRVTNMSNITEEPSAPSYTNGVNGVYSVVLMNRTPTANVVIPVNATHDSKNANYNEGRVYSATSSSPGSCTNTEITSLTFTPSNWNTTQYVCVKAQPDYKNDSDVQYIIQMANAQSSDSEYNDLNPRDVTVINKDKDTFGYSYSYSHGAGSGSGNTVSGAVTVTGFAVDDSGNFGTSYSCFSIALYSKPLNDVTLNFSVGGSNSDATLSVSSLTFTPANYSTTQQVCATGASDGTNEGLHDFDITFTVTSSDPGYGSGSVSQPTFRMRSCDNDASNQIAPCNLSGNALGTSSSRLTTTESGGAANMWLITQSNPGGTVTVGTTSTDTTEGSTPASVSITTSNYNKLSDGGNGNRVRVTGVDEIPKILDCTQSYSVTTATSTGALTFNPADIEFQNTDNETPYTITVTDSNTSEAGPGTGTIDIYLNFANTAAVNVSVSCSDSTECTSVSPSSLTWNTGENGSGFKKTITVTGKDDSWADGNQNFTVSFAASSTDPTYDPNSSCGANPPSQTMTNWDDEPAAKAIFVTSASYNGEFGGSSGVGSADVVCSSQKPAGAPAGTYKALLVSALTTDHTGAGLTTRIATTTGTDATGQTNWVLGANLYYYLWTGSSSNDENSHIFATNANKLFTFPMTRPFTTSSVDRFWTGMKSDMQAASSADMGDTSTPANCDGWSYQNHSVTSTPFWGNYGVGNSTGTNAISGGNALCSNNYKVICVEQ